MSHEKYLQDHNIDDLYNSLVNIRDKDKLSAVVEQEKLLPITCGYEFIYRNVRCLVYNNPLNIWCGYIAEDDLNVDVNKDDLPQDIVGGNI